MLTLSDSLKRSISKEDGNMEEISLNDEVKVSRLIAGMLHINVFSDKKALDDFLSGILELGITAFDHADNYGNGICEELFGEWLYNKKTVDRDQIQIISKCGNIHPADNRRLPYPICYNTEYQYILDSVDRSLRRLQTDYLDVLLLHRCDRLTDFSQVAAAFEKLRAQGKVKSFGVSNFSPLQVELLRSCWQEIAVNQLAFSVYDLQNFENDSDLYSMNREIRLMAYSPLANGALFTEESEKAKRLRTALEEIRQELSAPSIAHVAYAFLLRPPAKIMPVVGSVKLGHIRCAAEACNLRLTSNQWYYLYTASLGHRML